LKRPLTASGPILPPEKTSAILARAATALAALQARDGTWNEGSVHQPITRLQPLGFRQLKKEEVLKLPSERTFASTAQACAALLHIGTAVGMDTLLARFRANAMAGQAAQREMAETYLDGAGTGTNSMLIGRYLAPYDFIFCLQDVERALGGPVTDRGDLKQRLVFRVLKLQDSKGCWGKGFVPSQSPALFWHDDEIVCKPAYEREIAAIPKEKRQPYNSEWYWRRAHSRSERNGYSLDADVVATAYAMLFLESSLPKPVAGSAKTTDVSPQSQPLANAADRAVARVVALQKLDETVRIATRNQPRRPPSLIPHRPSRKSCRFPNRRWWRRSRRPVTSGGERAPDYSWGKRAAVSIMII
jgi:hypothetical protein